MGPQLRNEGDVSSMMPQIIAGGGGGAKGRIFVGKSGVCAESRSQQGLEGLKFSGKVQTK